MWIAITTDDVKRRISGAEYDALTAAALAVGQVAGTVVAEVIDDVIKLIRGNVAACAENTLGAGATIPDELRDCALAIIRWRIFTRLPNTGLADEPRRLEYSDAEKLLERVASCDFAIVPPETPAEDQAGGPAIELVASRERVATREKLSGL